MTYWIITIDKLNDEFSRKLPIESNTNEKRNLNRQAIRIKAGKKGGGSC